MYTHSEQYDSKHPLNPQGLTENLQISFEDIISAQIRTVEDPEHIDIDNSHLPYSTINNSTTGIESQHPNSKTVTPHICMQYSIIDDEEHERQAEQHKPSSNAANEVNSNLDIIINKTRGNKEKQSRTIPMEQVQSLKEKIIKENNILLHNLDLKNY